VALYDAGTKSEMRWAAPHPSGPPQNDFYFGGALALGGIAPATKPIAGTTGGTENFAKLSVTTNQVTFANTADGAVAATPLPTQGVADAGKRFAELAQLKLGAETEARAAGFGVNLSRAETENLARSRTLNRPQSATLEDLTATSVAPSPVATSKSVAVVPAEQKTAAETPRAALGVSPLGDARADFDSDTTVFYRQSDLGSLPQVALAIDALDKKAEAAPQVLSRFTVEQRGETLRLLETDGSVYEGTITNGLVAGLEESKLAGSVARDELLRETGTTARLQSVNGNVRSYYFRAAGSNVTLRQNVVVNGRISAGEDLVTQSTRSGSGRGGNGPVAAAGSRAASPVASSPAPARPPVQSTVRFITPGNAGTHVTNRISAIEGTVRVGLTNEQRFRAVQAPR
jgi:hypothetical protein